MLKKWTSVMALSMAGVMAATMAFAQGSGGGNTTPPQSGTQQPKPDGMNKDAGVPAASPATDATKPAADTKSDTMKSPDTKTKASDKKDGAKATDPAKAADTKSSDTMKSGDMKYGDAKKSGATKSGKMARGGNRENVRAAQQALKDKGMDPGAVDGMMGPKTQAALRDYQKKEGLKETGRLDAETMSKLGVATKSSAGATDQSTPAASPTTTPPASSMPAPADTSKDSKDASKDGAAKPDATKK